MIRVCTVGFVTAETPLFSVSIAGGYRNDYKHARKQIDPKIASRQTLTRLHTRAWTHTRGRTFGLISPFSSRLYTPPAPHVRLMHYKLYLVQQIHDHMTSTRTGPKQLRKEAWAQQKWDDEKVAMDEVRA